LGYLLSDGSTGVYFNDSTKIVLAACGDAFQYMERLRSCDAGGCSEGAGGKGASGERFEEHALSDYPPALHKKVRRWREKGKGKGTHACAQSVRVPSFLGLPSQRNL
jgi:hypothetical protein